MSPFGTLCAFPVTPFAGDEVDETGLAALVRRAVAAGADSVGALGSTGSYAYLTPQERRRLAEVAVAAADGTPVLVSVGAVRTRDVLRLLDDAQEAGVAGVLLAPVSYQRLTDDEVLGLYEDVTARLSVPLCVYDNPTTTGFVFSDALHARVAQLPGIASVKLPGLPEDAPARVAALRAAVPDTVTLGVSGDAHAARGLLAGCDTWYSVLAGALPATCRALADAAAGGDRDTAEGLDAELAPLWDLFARHGSLRVVAALLEQRGVVARAGLPRPVQDLPPAARRELDDVLRAAPAWA